MEYRKLGRTDLSVSAICLGSMTWGQQNTQAEGHEQLDYAVDQGVNFIDTAEIYSIPPRPETQGSTERILGSWLAARKNRDKVILATKVAGRGDSGWLRDDGGGTVLNRKNIHSAIRPTMSISISCIGPTARCRSGAPAARHIVAPRIAKKSPSRRRSKRLRNW